MHPNRMNYAHVSRAQWEMDFRARGGNLKGMSQGTVGKHAALGSPWSFLWAYIDFFTGNRCDVLYVSCMPSMLVVTLNQILCPSSDPFSCHIILVDEFPLRVRFQEWSRIKRGAGTCIFKVFKGKLDDIFPNATNFESRKDTTPFRRNHTQPILTVHAY